ncbi:MAG TPA: filamentous hemagglutinin family protein, partial [Steroidobacteraceae bacterium]|nr:filamentous hemagglutinin family protein [Steroidobacteraceae bacterium]
MATLNESMIAGGGFNSLKLETDGQLQLDAGVHLAVGGKLELYSPEIAVESGGDVSLRGAYVALGYNRGVASTATPSPGKGSLQVSGDVVDLLGSTVLQGVSRATIASGGDLRLRDVALPGSTVNTVGDLSLNGDLVLSAARIYPTSATRFSITTSGDVSHTVELKQVGTSSGVPLSVAGSVRIASSNIIQGGTLLAPFGKIELNGANSLTLTAGSVTSVSAGGALLPYGETQNGGKQWVYGLDANSQPAVVQGTPMGSVTLGGGAVKLDAGSVVDISGGGDLYAFEYVPGTGGKTDALNPANTPGLYAVLPSLSGQYAPIDKDPNYTNSSLQPGDSIYLSGLPGLPAGVYPLLPARYALLPGAFLVRAVPGSTNLQPGTVTGLPNGTPVVAGYRTFANNTLANAQYTGFAVYPGSYGRALAEYDDSLASKFFTGSASVPADAGRLNLLPVTSLDALGTVKTAPATGGRGATINLAATQLEVVGQPTGGSVGTVQISSAVLNAWNPSRLLLGGQWSADGKSIEVDADTVSVAGDANLSLGEITMVARNSVAVHSGAKVSSTSGTTGTAPKTAPQSAKVTLTGTSADGAALLAVSDSSSPLVQRASGAGGSAGGQILIDNGAHLASRGALVVDAPSGGALLGTFEGPGASWSVASNHLIFGAASDPSGLVLTPGVLSQMQTVKSLRLASASTIDFQTPVSLGTGSAPISELTLVAQGLNNLTSGGASTFAATNIVLQGTAGASAIPTTVPGQGSLTFSGTNVDVGGGTLAVSGFGKTSFNASGGFVGRDAGSLIANGDLTVTAARISAGVGSDRIITATGLTQLIGVNAGPGSPLPALELGGSLAFHSARITDSATIVAPSGIVSLQATDGLTLTSAASIDVAGTNVSAGGRTVSSSAGAIQLVSGGDLSAVAGSKLNVSGIGGSNAGLVQVTAQGTTDLGSTLLANAGSGAKGGSFEFRSGSLTNFSDLSSRLQAGGFTQEQSTHVSTGDLVVSAGSAAVVAHKVELITDGGSVDVAGTISAPSGADRSSLRLYGAQGVTLEASGALHADATGSGGPGSIEIGTSAGAVNLVSGSTITAAGSAGLGELRIRAPADTINNDIKVTALNSDLSKVGSVVLEPVMVFSSVFTDPTTAPDLTSVLNDTNNYANAALPNISQRLNAKGALPVSVQPGIELQGNGDITVGALDLSQWRFGPSAAAPPILTVRTTGSINVTGTISDGVTGSGTALNLPQCDATACPYSASASIRLTAGADLASADPNSVKTGGAGDLSLAASSVVRTGTGFISLNAAHDVKFGAGASVYTTGTPASTTVPVKKPVSTMTFPSLGGELNVNAGHDVIGAPVQQSVTAWQPRQVLGGLTQWGVDIGKFKWNLGTLGGGDLHVTAGHNVVDLSAATADSAIELSNRSAMSLYGGGSLAITAGNDIQSGMFYVAHGAGSIYAHGAIAASPTWTSQIGDPLGVLLQMGDAKVGIGARKDIVLEGILNPFVQPILGAGAGLSYFLTYGEQASLDLESTAGNLSINEQRDSRRLGSFLTNTFAGLSAFQGTSGALPGSITLHALSGDVLWSSTGSQTTALMPTDRGQLDVFAALDFLGGLTPVADGQPFQPGNSGLTMSDALTAGIATPLNPVLTPNLGTYFNYAVSARHVGDASPVLISAGRDIAGLELRFPKASRITAGRDITDVNLFGQNLGSADVTLISAGRDFTYSLANNSGQVQVGGPGRLDVLAGRQVDLGTSGGITTAGRLVNPNIPSAGGADLTVVAGLGAGMNVKQFIDDVVLKSSTDRAALVSFMEAKSGNKGMTVADAANAFEALDIDSQRPFVLDVFFSTLVQAGRDANTKPSTAFKGGYAAIDALFPGSRSTSNPYFGDISLAFSRIYTLAGGDISLVIPGGKLNVGLAVPPPTVGTRPASDLGIVAEGTGSVRVFAESDVLVNASRIFTLLGGDIAIWSTLGNIDAGKGAKSSVSAPPPTVSVDASGKVTINFTGAVSGSGIRTILTEPGITPGNVDLIAPVGFVNAGDAGVGSAGNLNIAAAHV